MKKNELQRKKIHAANKINLCTANKNKLLHTSNKSVHDCKLKFLHAANKIKGLRLSQFPP